MRVGLDARYVREKPSGIGAYVHALVDRLPYLAPHDSFLFCAHPLARRPLSDAPNAREITVTPGPNSPLTVWNPGHYVPLRELDLFHGPHNLMPRGIPCASVVTVHDVMAIERPDLHLRGIERLVKRWYYPQAVWRALKAATRVIVPTRAVADRIQTLVPGVSARVHVIWEAADPMFRPPHDPADALGRARALTESEAPFFLVVGAGTAAKRHETAVAAFAAVPPPWRLVLVQRRQRRSRLRALARRLGIEHRIVWLPTITQPDLVALLQTAGALLQPSVYEGFGLPVVEAMAAGCPVVASDIPPFREIGDNAVLLTPALDVQAWAQTLRALADNSRHRRELSARGLERAERFSWDRCAHETLAVYQEAAAR